MKKFFSLVLALVMALSLTTVAWGALNGAGTVDNPYVATSQEDLNAAVAAGGNITLKAGTYTFPAISTPCTIDCEDGVVFEGKSSLNIAGSTVNGATFSNSSDRVATGTINGIFNDCDFIGGYDALRYCYAGETVEFHNCVIQGARYGVHFDSGANDVLFDNCTISGFNAFGSALTNLTLDGCTFQAVEGNNYNGINLWGDTVITDCTFIFDDTAGTQWVDMCGDNKTLTITDSVVTDGTNETSLLDVVGDYGTGNTATVDGNLLGAVAEVNGTQYKSLQEAVDNAAGGTVTLLDNVTLTSAINVTDAVTIDGNGKTITMNYAGVPGTGNAIFNQNGGNEGISDSLTVKNLKMVMAGATKQGYAVVAQKGDSAFAASFDDCYFENMYCGVMLNGCGGTVAPTVTITDSTFKNVNYAVSFAEKTYAGDVSFEGNTMTGEIGIQEVFAANSGYLTDPTVEISSGTFSSDVSEYLASGVFQNTSGAVVALPTSVIPAGGATLAPKFEDRTDAQYASWNAKVSVKKAENAKDKEFAIYTIEMIAKVDNAPIWWDSGVADDKGDKEKFEFNGEREFVKVSAELAQFVIVDGKTITYFACADDINEDGWDEKVSTVTLPLIPNAQADWRCNAYYITDVADLATSFFWYEGDLYAPAATYTHVFNVAGVAVGAAEVVPFDTYFSASTAADRVVFVNHNYVVEYKGNGYGAENVSKVYCDVCKKSFDFAVGNELAAVAKFGEGKYFVLDTGLFVEKDTTPGTVRPSGSSSSGTSTDKVTSADTFDAGIAMYVGMSVMAAAGSAVVIGKKKD